MRLRKRGLAAALLCVLLFLPGCARKGQLLVSGLETEQISQAEMQQGAAGDPQADVSDAAGNLQTEASKQQPVYMGYVYVCGAVNTPGVYPVTEDMRVFEAVELAGGFAADADEQWLNLASPVSDGQQIYVYTSAETQELSQGTAQGQMTAGSTKDASDEKVNLNTATKEELMTLPGIGESKADAIIQYRTECGGFKQPEDIMNISGIKDAVFSKIKDDITVQ